MRKPLAAEPLAPWPRRNLSVSQGALRWAFLPLLTPCLISLGQTNGASQASANAGATISTNETLTAEAQWRAGNNAGTLPLLEIFLHNRTGRRVEWDKVLLNGADVRAITNSVLVWHQFYPSEISEPASQAKGPTKVRTAGPTMLLQVNLRENTDDPQRLEIFTKDGRCVKTELCWMQSISRAKITGLTYSADFRKIYLTYYLDDSNDWIERSLKQVMVNDQDLTAQSRNYEEPGLYPHGLVVVDLPTPLSQGDPVYLRLQFADGAIGQSLSRCWNRLELDDFGVTEKDVKQRAALGLDTNLTTRVLPGDPSCDDVHARNSGHSIKSILKTRAKWFREGDRRLAGPYLCTATSGNEHYNVYAQSADMLINNPYTLGWESCAKFPESEECWLGWAVQSACPKPAYWIPEVFTYGDRWLEETELRLMTTAMYGVGIKGSRYFVLGGIKGLKGYEENPLLMEAIKKVNAELRLLEPYLAPAIPVAKETYNSKSKIIPQFDERGRESSDQQYRVYTLWSGDQGILCFVRTLAYSTDRKPNDQGRAPRFRHAVQTNMTFRIDIPQWFHATGNLQAIDPLGKTNIPARIEKNQFEKNQIVIRLPELNLTQVLWIPNSPPGAKP